MKTFAIYRIHPFGKDIIITQVGTLHSDNTALNITPYAFYGTENEFIWNGGITLPDAARCILYPNICFASSNTSIYGFIFYEHKLHVAAIDICYCDDSYTAKDFI